MFGANHIINYKKNPNWSLNVMEITKGKGVDIISDCVLASNFIREHKVLGKRREMAHLLDHGWSRYQKSQHGEPTS